MSSIFISHSSKDNDAAEAIKAWLEGQGHTSLFLDFDPDAGIKAGTDWEQVLYRELRQCQAVIVLLTPNWLASRWCFAEVVQAREKGKAIFVAKVLPCDDSAVLSQLQHVDLTNDAAEGYYRLAEGLRAKGLDPRDTFDWDPKRPPYPGLQNLDEKDAAIFFGRDPEIFESLELLNSLRRKGANGPRFILCLGASGSGKSSLVRAGLLPRLRKDAENWLPLRPFRPQKDPIEELAVVLAGAFKDAGQPRNWQEIRSVLNDAAASDPPDARALSSLVRDLQISTDRPDATVLMVIDQTEELIGSSGSDLAGQFLGVLRSTLAVCDRRLMVLATMRSDFLGEFQLHPAMVGLDFESLTIGPMLPDNLPQVIEKPAILAGLRLEDGLVTAILQDATTRDVLPLLAFTLRRLYDNGSGDGLLEVQEYHALGGLAASVRYAADQVIKTENPTPEELEALRSAFIPNMVRIGEDGQYARRLAYRDQLPAKAAVLLEQFVAARLLVGNRDQEGRETLEVAHEALLRTWPTLIAWLQEDEYKLRLMEGIRRASLDWQKSERDSGLLVHREGRLQDVQDLVREDRFTLVEQSVDQAYLMACIAAQTSQERAQRRRRRLTLLGLTVGLLLTTGGAVVAVAQLQRAEQERMRQFETISKFLAETDPAKSLVNAVAAIGLGRSKFVKFPRPNQSDLVPEVLVLAPLQQPPHKVFDSINVNVVAISPDSKTLISAGVLDDGSNPTLQLLNLNGDPIGKPFLGHEDAVRSVAFSPDGKTIVTGGEDRTVRLWDLKGNSIGQPFLGHEGAVRSVAFSSDGETIVTASEDRTVRWWDLEGNPIGQPLRGRQSDVMSVAFSPDGKTIVTGSLDKTVRLWDLKGNPIGQPLRGHKDAVRSVAFSPDGKTIASGSLDKTVRLWDLKGNPIGQPFLGHEGSIWSVTFSPDGKTIASGSLDKTVRLWDLNGNPIGKPFQGPEITFVRFSPDGEFIISLGLNSTAQLWDLQETTSISKTFLGHEKIISSVAFSPNGKTIVSSSGDTLRIWELNGSSRSFQSASGISSVAISPDGKIIAVRSFRNIGLLDANGTPIIEAFEGKEVRGTVIAFSPDGKTIASDSNLKNIRLWNLNGNPISKPLQGHEEVVTSIAFSPDGKTIASSSTDKTIRLWNLNGQSVDKPFVGHEDAVISVAFSPDGKTIASGSTDKTVRLWDLKGNLIGQPFLGHEDAVWSVAFSPDGKTIASGSTDKTIRLWDLNGNPIGKPFQAHEAEVMAVAFSPDGKTIVSGSFDRTVRLWGQLPWPGWLPLACQRISPDNPVSDAHKEAVRTCQRYVWSADKGKK